MRYRTLFLTITLALCTPGRVLAQSTDVHARADEQFREGREALAQGNDKLALQLFRSSQELESGRGKLLNIALCEEKLGQLTAAIQHFEQVLPQLPSGDERLTIVQQHLAALALRVPHLRVDLAAGTPTSVGVTYDGAPLGPTALGTEVAVDPGEHVITVNATGLPERRYDVLLEEGKNLALKVEAGVAAGAEVSLPPKATIARVAPQPPSSKRKVGFIVGGVGIAGLAAGAVTGILALVDRGAIESQCPTHQGCSPDIVNQASSGKSLSVVSTVAFAAGFVGVGAGAYLVLSGGKSAAAPTVGLTLSPDGGRVGIRGAF